MHTSEDALSQNCVSVERPSLTLARVVVGMPVGHEHRKDALRLRRYISRVSAVLRILGKGLRHLHERGAVHGGICPKNCGKFGEVWKITGLTGAEIIGGEFTRLRLGVYSPPESVSARRVGSKYRGHDDVKMMDYSLRKSLGASPAIDMWAFGKLMYEVFVGKELIPSDPEKEMCRDSKALTALGAWDTKNLKEVVGQLSLTGIGSLGADLVSHCLCPSPDDRPRSMEEILKHPFWKETRKRGKTSSRDK